MKNSLRGDSAYGLPSVPTTLMPTAPLLVLMNASVTAPDWAPGAVGAAHHTCAATAPLGSSFTVLVSTRCPISFFHRIAV